VTSVDLGAAGSAMPTYSVVIPNYNHAHYLGAALKAYLSQTVPPLEIIVVDDASTDESCGLVECVAASHPCVRLIRLERRVGVNGASNRGLRDARGDYVHIAAADDVVLPSFAARSLELLRRHPTAGFCFSDPAELIDDRVRRFSLFLSNRPVMLLPSDVEFLMRRNMFTFSSATTVYRRDAFLSLGGFREELDWQADWFANFALAFRYGACYVPAVLVHFRLRADSYSAVGVRQASVQRDLTYRILDLLDSEDFRDVAPQFRHSGLLPELSSRALLWLLASPRHRGYLTPVLVFRLLSRGFWSVLRPHTPVRLRRWARGLGGASTRRRLAARRLAPPAGDEGQEG